MANVQEIVEDFIKENPHIFNHNIAIYGTGIYAGILVERINGHKISAVIDRDKSDGDFHGIPICRLEDACKNGTEIIIIAAAVGNELIIYDRIKDVTRAYEIDVYGLHICGSADLYSKYKLYSVNDDNLNIDRIKQLIDDHDVISFDIFDTILSRRTLIPQDVFLIMERILVQKDCKYENFAMHRIGAEKNIVTDCPNIDEIYQELGRIRKLDDHELEFIRKLELDIEKKVIKRREQIYELLDYAVKNNKRVAFISDMYLRSFQIEELLRSSGINEDIEIFVSCEYRKGKTNGLFKEFTKRVNGNEYLHIGDNKTADGTSALLSRMDSVLIPSPQEKIDAIENRSFTNYLTSVNDRNIAGLFINKIMDRFFDDKIKIDSIYDFAQLFVAPIITTYVLWLIKLQEEERFEVMLFPSRDGFLLKKLYDYGMSVIGKGDDGRSVYFSTSRKACIRACCCNRELKDIISQILGYTDEDMIRYIFDHENDDLTVSDIEELSEAELHGIMEYMKSLRLRTDGRYAFAELTSGGTCQYLLQEIFFHELFGLYFCQVSSAFQCALNIKSLYREHYLDWTNRFFSHIDHIVLMESVITSDEPSVAGFNIDGSIKYEREYRSEGELNMVREAHEGIFDYFREYIDIYIREDNIEPSVPKRIFSFNNSDRFEVSDDVLSYFKIIDSLQRQKTFVVNQDKQ